MAGKPLNRMELRRQSEAAEPLDPMEDETDDVVEDADDDEVSTRPKKKAKAPAKTKAKAKSARAPKPAARMRIVWVVLNDAYKPIATFDYNQKEAADAKAAEMTAKGKGTHFVQRTKEAMAEDAPGIGATIPRPEVAPTKAKAAVKSKRVEAVLDEIEDDEEDDDDVDADADDESDDESDDD